MTNKVRHTIQRFLAAGRMMCVLMVGLLSSCLLAVLLTLAGCAEDDAPEADGRPVGGGRPVTVMLNLSVNINGVPDRFTRAEGITTPGTKEESAVKSLTVFVVDVDDNGQPEKMAQHATFYINDWDGSGKYEGGVKMKTSTGRKHIYVGANFTQRQIDEFSSDVASVYTAAMGSDYDHYHEMMAEFIRKGGFTMLGRATQDGRDIIEIPDEPEPEVDMSVNLTRVVAKVLVVMEAEEHNGIKYAVLRPREDHPDDTWEEKSWIRLNDMHFILNVTNRKTYLYQRTKETDGRIVVVDPNHEFESVIKLDGDMFRYQSDLHARQFVRWVPHKWDTEQEWGMPVMEYDADRMPGANVDGNVYTEGLYCLENTVGSIPEDWKTVLDGENEALTLMATTYVLIAARITPRWIITRLEEDPEVTPDAMPYKATSEEDAWRLLAECKEHPTEYPVRTFYTHDRVLFYSYDGMMARIKNDEDKDEDDPTKLTRENFLAYPAGWGYYFTYVDGENEDHQLKFSEQSGVLRNNYYILHVRKLGAPPLPGDGGVNMMELDVTRYGWTDAGTGDITLKP